MEEYLTERNKLEKKKRVKEEEHKSLQVKVNSLISDFVMTTKNVSINPLLSQKPAIYSKNTKKLL